uniref:Polyhomeotic homolog 1 n=1 Tax=Nothobranchius furzeri TaxID=105023 RepID=A0A8C6P002_NOTFU
IPQLITVRASAHTSPQLAGSCYLTPPSLSFCPSSSSQALQALQRQPNAAQYFQQLMLQQQINSAQLQNLAAVQQVKVCLGASLKDARNDGQADLMKSHLVALQASVTSGSASTTSSRPLGVSAASSISQSVQNLALRGVSSPKGVKTEAPEKSDSGRGDKIPTSTAYSLVQPSHHLASQSPTKPNPQPPHIKIPTYPQPANLKAHPSSSSGVSSTSSIPLSQLLLHGTRTLTTGAAAPTLVLTSNATSQPHGYPVGTATIKPAVNTQTLVVQPLQKSSLGAEKPGHANGPVPIQPKTLQGLRLPLQVPSRNPPPILPAPTPTSSSNHPTQPPHIPVQIVGARQSTLGGAQALALARGSCSQEGAAVLSSSSSLLTMVASIASREGGVAGRGVGLKTLQTPQEAPPLAQASRVHPQASQSSAQSQNGALGKQTSTSLKRKSDSSAVNDEDGPTPPQLQPLRDPPSASPTNPVGSASPPASSSPTPALSVSRGACAQGERASPPQAVVKPQVLTHLIEGFVIQEGAEPFPTCGPIKDSAGEDLTDDMLKCEYCKNFAPASQFRGTKRFCSMSCAKRYFRHSQRRDRDHLSNSDDDGGIARRRVPRRTSSEIASAKIAGRPIPAKCRSESSHSDKESSGEEDEDDAASLSPASSGSCHLELPPPPPLSSAPNSLPGSPSQWSVEEVSRFISSLQGCEELVSQFLSQEIDGQALLLLKEEHLMSTMNIKLGPALKICAHINSLRD